MKNRLVHLIFALASVCVGQSQTHVAVYAVKGQPTADCIAAAQTAASIIARYPHPGTWRYVAVCDSDSWAFVNRKLAPHEDPSTIYGITRPKAKTTFLRAESMTETRPGQPTGVHIIAHELAHIMLKTADEALAERTACCWMAKRNDFDSLAR